MTTETLYRCRHLIGGEWQDDPSGQTTEVFNPSRGELIAETPGASSEVVDQAVQSSLQAFRQWRQTPVVERARVLYRFRHLLDEQFDEICRCISREHGKTLAESRGELQRGIECVEYSCGAPELMKGEYLEDIASHIDCEVIHQPVGVCVGITPFNFPAMIGLWMFPMALACGNAFILKPSEKTPLTAEKLAGLLLEAGLPKGVLNLVHGSRETVDALLTHPDVKAVSFVGSSPVAQHIHRTATEHGKRVQANGGAKNHAVIMPDADTRKAVEGILGGAFGCAGERCMAIATTIVVGEARDRILPEIVKAAKNIRTGPTDVSSQPDMGPLISKPHRDRVAELIDQSLGQGAKAALDGRSFKASDAPNGFFLSPSIIDEIDPSNSMASTEVFGPVLGVMSASTLEEAIELVNQSPFGNGATLFTTSGHHARSFKYHVTAGMVGINVGVPAPMAMFPFSGWKGSFYGDTHIQGRDSVRFYTQRKTVTSRWFGDSDVWKK